MNLDTVTRFEVIGNQGRLLTKYGIKLKLSVQDDERTLKVFLTDREVCKTCDGNGFYYEQVCEKWMGSQQIPCDDCSPETSS